MFSPGAAKKSYFHPSHHIFTHCFSLASSHKHLISVSSALAGTQDSPTQSQIIWPTAPQTNAEN